MRRRWDDDERGRGIASAGPFAPGAERLLASMREPDWVAEDPQLHLLPHLRRVAEREGWSVEQVEVEDAILVVDVRLPAGASRQELRIAGFALAGAFAEELSFLEERRDGDVVRLEVVTGMPDGSGSFGPHGHTVRLRLSAS